MMKILTSFKFVAEELPDRATTRKTSGGLTHVVFFDKKTD